MLEWFASVEKHGAHPQAKERDDMEDYVALQDYLQPIMSDLEDANTEVVITRVIADPVDFWLDIDREKVTGTMCQIDFSLPRWGITGTVGMDYRANGRSFRTNYSHDFFVSVPFLGETHQLAFHWAAPIEGREWASHIFFKALNKRFSKFTLDELRALSQDFIDRQL